MKMAEWKQQALTILPPYVALKPDREILCHLWLHLSAIEKEEFTYSELKEDFKSLAKKSVNPITKAEYEKCLPQLSELLELLRTANLLTVNGKVYKKSQNFPEFWYFISHILSVEKLVKWGAYYLAKKGRQISSENLREIIEPESFKNIDADLLNIEIFEDKEWKKVLDKQNGRWVIKKTYDYMLPSSLKPFLVSAFHNKVLHTVQSLSHETTEFKTEDIVKFIKLKEQEEIERVLRKLGFKKQNKNQWEFANVDLLIKDLENPLRSPRGWIEFYCIGLLDKGSYSWTELADISKADPTTLSRSLKRLKREKIIIQIGEGKYGRHYYITNCDKCPFSTDKETCKSNLMLEIETTMKKFNMPKPTVDLKRFSNQVLKKFIDILTEIKTDRTEKVDIQELRQLTDGIFEPLLKSILEDQKQASDIYQKYGPVKHATKLAEKEYPVPYLYASAVKKTRKILCSE